MRFGTRRARARGAALTPMVDVVFLLLFFFMLASRFGTETGLELALAGDGAAWTGPPRLVEVGAGAVFLNGVPTAREGLPGALDALVADRADPVILAPRDGARVADLVAVLEDLGRAGFTRLGVAE